MDKVIFMIYENGLKTHLFEKHLGAIELIGDVAVFISYSPDVRSDFVSNEDLAAFIVTNFDFEVDKLKVHRSKFNL